MLSPQKSVFPVSVLLLLSLTITTGGARAAIDATIENKSALSTSARALKTRMPTEADKKPAKYILELHATQTVRPFGNEPMHKIEIPLERIESGGINLDTGKDDTGVIIETPPIASLIRLKDHLNPFSLDATYVTRIALREVLETVLNQNLDVDSAFVRTKSQKWQTLSTASGFLPNVNAGYSLFGIKGAFPGAVLGGGGGSANLPSMAQLLTAGFTYNAYQGGKILFGTLADRHRYRATRAGLKTNINDSLLQSARRYYELLNNEALLAIRTRAVSISEEQVRLNTAHEKAGIATGLDVLQSQAQLASDEQNLIEQQNARRQSAIQLAHLMNSSFTEDFKSADRYLQMKRLVPNTIPIEQLLKLAIDQRPELKQYEELRLAAKRAIMVAAAPLQPNVSLGGTVYGIGASGTNIDSIYTLNFGVKWFLGGLGTTDLANMQKARWEARQAAIQAKQTFLTVFEEVRTSYNSSLAADKKVDRATVQIQAAEEELRIARKRMDAGVGLNIDVLNAQRDLTQASINKARAILEFNVAQAQLLRDVGSISVAGLLDGIK